MKDIDRNCRTLIVCFVVAVFGLIPLRFYEVGSYSASYQSEVLGEYVSLPNSEVVDESVIVLEKPYEEMERLINSLDCLPQVEVDAKIGTLVEALKTEGLDEETVSLLMGEIEKAEDTACR